MSSSTLTLSKTSSMVGGEVQPCAAGNPPVSLPDFPVIKVSVSLYVPVWRLTVFSRQDFHLPHSVPADRLNTFLTMYRVHCQQLFTVIARCDNILSFPLRLKFQPSEKCEKFPQNASNIFLRFSFSELECLVVTFWSHVPSCLSNLLYSRAVVSVVAVCDSVLYKAAVKAVLPSPSLPGSLASPLQLQQ